MCSPSNPPIATTMAVAVAPPIISTDEVNRLMHTLQHNQVPSTREALLELKRARSKAAAEVKPPQLSQTTKQTIVHYILHSFSQPHGEPPDWTKEQRWDHQDLCLEMLKTLSMHDVNDIVRAYNAWKNVNDITLRQDYDATSQTRPLMLDQCDQRSCLSIDMRGFHTHNIKEDESEGLSLLHERHKAEADEKAKQILLNAERHKTISSDGMFSLDNTSFLAASLAQQDLVVVLQFDRQAQEMFLLGDEADREALLQLSPLGRVEVVGEWIAKSVDNRNILVAATRAKGHLLTSDERRLLLAMEEEDCRYHLHMWKHWQQQDTSHVPTPNLAFLQLNGTGRRRPREEYFRVPRYWSKYIKVRDTTIQPMPLTVIRPFLWELYHAAAKQRIDAYDFVEFVVQHMTLQFGAQTRHRLQGLITALEQYCIKDSWVFAFCRFCGIAEQLPSDCFTFYVSALQCLQFAVPNRAQQADYYIPSDVFYPLFVKKAVMALRTIASDANIDEAKWYATLRECRVLCPRKTVLGSPIYVVGLGAFMDLVLDIWLSNRRTMEDEMRRMFVQFDTDQSKSLSYDEFRAFIVHCHKTLQESASTRQSFCQRVVDEKNVVKLYGKCLMQSDQSEINIDSFVLGGMESMCLSTRCST
ncbi:hypothetical protein DYB37_006741 [Aphanomyces astaci]|uniref:EF-hand domain-containing protein n=2 Tax=Aphanomyces astaci TaxID=112090 RepID=A0A3R7BY97_APHAT|nr:hypothetical protein DYB37_006741 [Aphanomyces astaci]